MNSPVAPPSPTPSAPEPPTTHRSAGSSFDRRTLILSAAVLFGALLIGIGAIAVFSDPGKPNPETQQDETPHIIARPNSGTAPKTPGDRGGSEQLLLMAGMVVVLVGIGFVVFRGGKKTRANREKWKAAGQSGQDGAVS